MKDQREESPEELGRHLACTLSAGIIRRVRSLSGDAVPRKLLETAHSTRTLEYLEDISNWLSLEEAIALFEAAALLTGDDQIARRVGEDAVRYYAGTPVATGLRSLGSVEEMLRQIATVSSKFTVVSELTVLEMSPGRAVLMRRVREGFDPQRSLCDWGLGLLSAAPMLYAVPPATIEEAECQVRGDERCLITVSWDRTLAARTADPAAHITALEAQLVALNESSESMYAAAGDLIADNDLHSTLAKITERSATAVRAPRYLLVVRPEPGAELQIHHRGLSEAEARELAGRVLSADASEVDDRWLLADIRSHRYHYGRIAALHDEHQSFFVHELQTLQHYARYAANALDGAIALADARSGHAQTRALLDFARSLAGASSAEVARLLAEAVPRLVDCDRVTVSLRELTTERLTCVATYGYPPELDKKVRGLCIVRGETDPELGRQLFDQDEPFPLFFDRDSTSPFVQEMFRTFKSAALVLVPIIVRGRVLGSISVAVSSTPARLRESSELNNRLSGIAAQAAVGLENGDLIDRISYQARHDALTGVANRSFFSERFQQTLESARESGEPVGLFYVDLDEFKLVNDNYGHAAGDELLCQVAARLLSTVRAHDTIARLGGDEFAIIFHDAASPSQVEAAATRVAHAFDKPFRISGCDISMRASIGHAIWPYDADELSRLMRHADASMYSAKRVTVASADHRPGAPDRV